MTPPDDLRLAVERVSELAFGFEVDSDVERGLATLYRPFVDQLLARKLDDGKPPMPERDRRLARLSVDSRGRADRLEKDAAALRLVTAELTKAQAALAEAREALEPFAKLAALMDSFAVSDGESPPKPLADEDDISAALGDLFFEDGCGATVGDLRRARAVAKPGASDV